MVSSLPYRDLGGMGALNVEGDDFSQVQRPTTSWREGPPQRDVPPKEMDNEPQHSSLATPSKACACNLIFFPTIIIRRLWGILRTSQRAHHPRDHRMIPMSVIF